MNSAEAGLCDVPLNSGILQLSDNEAVKKVMSGDVDAFEAIMRRYNQRLFRVVRSVLKNDTDAEDAVQETYIKAYLKLDQCRDVTNLSGWLTRIAFHEALAKKRKDIKLPILTANEELDRYTEADTMQTHDMILPDRLAHSGALRRLIEAAIDELPDKFRTVFIMRVVEQISVRETAGTLDIEEATVKSRQHRALLRLQERLHFMYQQQVNDSFGFAGKRCDRLVLSTMARLRSL